MIGRAFQRNIENFTCEHCGNRVEGNGYTNHCPKCLWSKHVDVNPGDREEGCGGMMKPVKVEFVAGEYIVLHVCTKCGFERKNKVGKEDNFEEVVKISKNFAEK